ncbi:MAG TPA: 8-amino-7-oxononanoate synthase [Chthoniobacterales bacterium]|nr:8-amino-7-oxononanoate synthase [Chthoniobacterales bacterium]
MLSYDEILNQLRDQSLFRELRTIEQITGPLVRVNDRTVVNFASNDYLGLSQHPAVKMAAKAAIEEFGAGAGASRLVTGTESPHTKVEKEIAAFKGVESAIVFSSGYAAAVGTITSVAGPGDVIILDKLAHACLIDGAKLSGAALRVFPHNDIAKLQSHLTWARRTYPSGKALIVTESMFSMDGTFADLTPIVGLKKNFDALLMVDEAHATGVIGPNGTGWVSALGLTKEVDIQMGTLSKALGASGGFICGSASLIQLLVNKARSFIYSTALPPASAAAASEALKIVHSPEGKILRGQLLDNVLRLDQLLAHQSHRTGDTISPIFPVMIGDEGRALVLAAALLERGILAPAIRYPTVARGSARIRIALSSLHSNQQVSALAETILLSK